MTGVVFAQNEGDYFDLHLLTFADSKTVQLTYYIGNAFSPKFSPDGSQILFLNQVKDAPASIWVMGPMGEKPRQLYAARIPSSARTGRLTAARSPSPCPRDSSTPTRSTCST